MRKAKKIKEGGDLRQSTEDEDEDEATGERKRAFSDLRCEATGVTRIILFYFLNLFVSPDIR